MGKPSGFRLYAPPPGWLATSWLPPPRLSVRCPDFTFVVPLPITPTPLALPGSHGPLGQRYIIIITLPAMLTGTVKFYNDSKGFGFIVADDNQEEIFVHQTGLIHEIQEGDRVEFDLKEGKKGPNAVKVTRLQ